MPRRCVLPPRCHTHTQNARTFLLVGRYGSVHQMVGAALPQVSSAENISPNYSLAYTLRPLAQQPRNILQRWHEETLTSSYSRTASAGERICSLSPPRNSQLKEPPTSSKSVHPPLGMPIDSRIRQRTTILRTACNRRLQTSGYTQTHDKRLPPERKRRRRTCKPHHGTNASHGLQRTPKRLGCTPSPREVCL